MASKVGLGLDDFDLAESIHDIAICQLTNDDAFKSLFITLAQILNSRNLNSKADEKQIEKILQCVIAIRDSTDDVVNFKYRESLITSVSHVYLRSLGNKIYARKTEKVLHIVSSFWHTELMDTLLSKVSDLLSNPHLTAEQMMKVSAGLEESKLFREAVNKNLLPLLTHLNNTFVSISECVSSLPQGDHPSKIKERDITEHVPKSLGSHDDLIVKNTGYSTTSGSPVYNHTELCYTCVKVCLQVFQYMPQSVAVLLWESTSTDQSFSSNLINNLQAVLSRRYSKDCNLIAGSALAMLVNTIETVEQAMLLIQLLCGDFHAAVNIGNTQISSLSHDLQDGPYSKIAIIRGILTCCKPRLLLSTGENEDCILLHSLFTEVVSFCQHPNHTILYNAFQLLVYWYESAIATLDQYISSTPESDRKTCFHSESQFVKNTLQLIWENWQNPLTGVPTFVKTTFSLLLEIHHKENQLFMIPSSELYSSLVSHLLQISWHVKGKYALLGSLVPYIRALNLLSSHPTLPRQLVRGLATNFLASSVSDLHRVLLQNMKKEIEQGGTEVDSEDGDAALRWKRIWGDCVLDVLCSEHQLIRFHGAQFWLPWILKCFPGVYNLLMASLDMNTMPSSSTLSLKHRLHALMMVMAQARLCDIIKFTTIEENIPLIRIALEHVDDDIRLSALALVCNSPKRAEPLQQIELDMLYRFLPLNFNCDGASFRQKMCAYIKAIITRIRDSCLGSLKMLNRKKPDVVQKADEQDAPKSILQSGITFLDWLLQKLMESLFPGACYQRKRAVLGLLAILYEVMLSKWQCNKKKGQTPESAGTLITWAHQNNKCHFICERYCYLLLDNLLDGSNDNRDLAYKILSEYFPWPLPGLKVVSGMEVNRVLSDGLQLICSPKSPECEAGSKLCVLVFQRHILEGKDLPSRLVGAFKTLKIEVLTEGPNGALPFLKQITESLVYQHKCCAQNILYGSFITPMHGLLLTIRKCLSINVPTLQEIMQSDRDGWMTWITNLIATASDIVSLAMSTLSSPIGGTVETELSPSFADMGEGIDDLIQKIKKCQIEGQQEEEAKILSNFETGEENPSMSASHQLILACCWLNLKEVSLLLGDLSQCVPFKAESEHGLLTTSQLQMMTDIFISILTKCRHRGAIEGCNLGFSKLCASLLASPSHELSTIPKGLLRDLILMITNEGSTSSFTKKSAGLPLVLEAVINSEPKGREKSLLRFTMTSLLDIAQQPEPVEHDPKLDLPQCHALNMLKALFRSSAINDDVMPYTSKSVTIAIHGFASKHFSIRNGSMLLFGSLVARMFGQKRVQDEHSRVNSMTAREFFVHYPELQSFLLQEICKCVDQQVAGRQNLHPSLFPVLIILSKLGCGLQTGETSDLNKFMQPVMQLCASPVYQVRALAAEALVPLVAEDKMLTQAACIIDSLPGNRQEANSQNQLHGQLLQIQKLFSAHKDNTVGLPPSLEAYDTCRHLCAFQWIGCGENNCPLTRAVYIDTTTKLLAWLVTDKTNSDTRSLADDSCKMTKCYLSLQHPQQVYYIRFDLIQF
ncbi:thyroid adenoma-associated protein-like isoform X2 [Anneissia japonica]|uniref:thyroid adenoma-associated protein-like isoform X2 n=1 Tax=Anneissia japonica TaxID=1529436 RepID=UPI001425B243|nr:thyroid adenoma-associated protein-like isoform X2 [Anneissia japonica]